MDAERAQQSAVALNRAALIAIAALANGIASLPYLLFAHLLLGLPVVVLGSALLAWFTLRKLTTEATAQPSLGEWVLGAWSAVFTPSVAGLAGLIFFGLFYGGVHLFLMAARFFGFASHANPSAWGFWGSVWFVAPMMILGATESLQELSRQLYPREAGARSAFFPLLPRWKLLALVGVAALVALAVMLWLLDPHGIAFTVLLAVLLLYTSLPLVLLGSEGADTAQVKIIDALAALLQEGGYRIVRAPRTGKAEIDPLLKSVDLLARTGDRAFAVQVKSIASNAPVEWNEASALRTAADLLSDEIVTGGTEPVPVEPVLMLVGGTVAQSLAAFSQRERIPLVLFKDTADATDDRAELTRRLQAAGLVFPSPPAPSSALA